MYTHPSAGAKAILPRNWLPEHSIYAVLDTARPREGPHDPASTVRHRWRHAYPLRVRAPVHIQVHGSDSSSSFSIRGATRDTFDLRCLGSEATRWAHQEVTCGSWVPSEIKMSPLFGRG